MPDRAGFDQGGLAATRTGRQGGAGSRGKTNAAVFIGRGQTDAGPCGRADGGNHGGPMPGAPLAAEAALILTTDFTDNTDAEWGTTDGAEDVEGRWVYRRKRRRTKGVDGG